MRRGRGLRQVGRRATSEIAERAAMRDAVIAETGGACVARRLIPEVRCWGGIEVHEVIDRSVRPGVHLDPAYGVTVCHAHHLVITDDATRARELGLSFFSHDWAAALDGAVALKAGAWR